MLTSRPFSCYMNYICNQHQFTLSKHKQILSILSNSASWRRLMRVPWTSRRSNQSILKEISPEYSLEGLTLKLTLSPVLWPPDAKKTIYWKRPWCWARLKAGGEGKGTTENEMLVWHHLLSGHELEQALGGGDGQGSQVCCSPWGCKELDMTEQVKWLILNKFWYLE